MDEMEKEKERRTASRNAKGFAGFLLLSLLLGYIVEAAMVAREVWQWKRYKLPKFEWDDIARYTAAIAIGGTLNLAILAMARHIP